MTAALLTVLVALMLLGGAVTRYRQHRRSHPGHSPHDPVADRCGGFDPAYWCARAAVLLRLDDTDLARYRQLRAVPMPADAAYRYQGVPTAVLLRMYRRLPAAAQLDLVHAGGDLHAHRFWRGVDRLCERRPLWPGPRWWGPAAELWQALPQDVAAHLTGGAGMRRRMWARIAESAHTLSVPAAPTG